MVELAGTSGRQETEAESLELIRKWLRDDKNGQWLVVLDDLEDAGLLLKPLSTNKRDEWKWRIDYFPVCSHGSVVITTRNIGAATRLVQDSEVVKVGPMDEVHARLLLEKELDQQPTDEKDLTALAKRLRILALGSGTSSSIHTTEGRTISSATVTRRA